MQVAAPLVQQNLQTLRANASSLQSKRCARSPKVLRSGMRRPVFSVNAPCNYRYIHVTDLCQRETLWNSKIIANLEESLHFKLLATAHRILPSLPPHGPPLSARLMRSPRSGHPHPSHLDHLRQPVPFFSSNHWQVFQIFSAGTKKQTKNTPTSINCYTFFYLLPIFSCFFVFFGCIHTESSPKPRKQSFAGDRTPTNLEILDTTTKAKSSSPGRMVIHVIFYLPKMEFHKGVDHWIQKIHMSYCIFKK